MNEPGPELTKELKTGSFKLDEDTWVREWDSGWYPNCLSRWESTDRPNDTNTKTNNVSKKKKNHTIKRDRGGAMRVKIFRRLVNASLEATKPNSCRMESGERGKVSDLRRVQEAQNRRSQTFRQSGGGPIKKVATRKRCGERACWKIG